MTTVISYTDGVREKELLHGVITNRIDSREAENI